MNQRGGRLIEEKMMLIRRFNDGENKEYIESLTAEVHARLCAMAERVLDPQIIKSIPFLRRSRLWKLLLLRTGTTTAKKSAVWSWARKSL
jgi:hypothetical protein